MKLTGAIVRSHINKALCDDAEKKHPKDDLIPVRVWSLIDKAINDACDEVERANGTK